MEENEPFLYSYAPFSPCATDLMTEHPFGAYDASLQFAATCCESSSSPIEPVYSRFSGKTIATDGTKRPQQPLLQSQPLCPRCYNPVVEHSNWCSSCGELLIGASSCSSDLGEWSVASVSYRPIQMAHAEPINFTTDFFPQNTSTGGYQSFSVDDGRGLYNCQNFQHRAISTITTEPSHAAASFISTSSLTTPHTRTQQLEQDTLTTAMAEQTSQAFHVAETSVPHSVQVDSLQSAMDELQLKNEPPVSIGALQYVSSTAQEYAAPCFRTAQTGSPQVSSSHPESMGFATHVYSAYCHPPNKFDCAPMVRTMQQLSAGRQRCISGPVRNNAIPTDHGITTSFQYFDLPFVSQPLDHNPQSFASSFGFPTQDNTFRLIASWPTSSSASSGSHAFSSSLKPEMFPAADPVPPTASAYKSIAALRRDQHQANGSRRVSNRQRQKHTSECSRSQLLMPPVRDQQGQFIYRPRSSSSDLRRSGPNSTHPWTMKPDRPQSFWSSSRIAWSAHDPGALKKKPASYLRASFSHGSNTPSGYHRSFQAGSSRCDSSILGGPVRPVSRSAQPKLRGEHVVHQEHGLVRGVQPAMGGQHTTQGSSSSQVERRPRKGRSQKNPSRKAKGSPVDVNLHRSRESSANIGLDEPIGSQSDPVSNKSSPHGNPRDSAPINCVKQPDWMSFPDELWLSIIRALPTADRGRMAQVCRRFSSLVADRSLWRVIQLHRHQHLTDTALATIGRLRPRELRLTYCRGDMIEEEGLRRMFMACGTALRKLSFIGCTKGPFDRDVLLLLAAEHCPNLSHLNASYTQAVRDRTVMALAKSAFHLISVKLNGAQQISNAAIQQLVHYHKDTLERLELFGCFRLNSDIFQLLGRCQELRALAFGHLHHLSSDGLLELVGKLPHLASLDLRGTQTLANDTNLTRLADKCPHLEEVVLANMHSLKGEAGIAQMLRRLPRLRVLDLCGLSAVGDLTMEALAHSCPHLEELDVSCTSVTQTGLLHLTRVPAAYLRCLRISHCREITKEVLEKLVKACPKLTLLYAYGFNSIKDWSFLQSIRPALLVENDA